MKKNLKRYKIKLKSFCRKKIGSLTGASEAEAIYTLIILGKSFVSRGKT